LAKSRRYTPCQASASTLRGAATGAPRSISITGFAVTRLPQLWCWPGGRGGRGWRGGGLAAVGGVLGGAQGREEQAVGHIMGSKCAADLCRRDIPAEFGFAKEMRA
jgi:hypothetical protein